MAGPVHIVATGARTPLGMRSNACAAAVRASISRLGFHPSWLDRLGEPMVAAMDARIDAGLLGAERLVALAETALRDVCSQLPRPLLESIPVHLALPEVRPGFSEQTAMEVGFQLGQLQGLPLQLGSVLTQLRGHAGGVLGLQAALSALQTGLDICLVGGVESYFQLETMTWLDNHRQLAGSDGRSSFVPGEGAGFLLLATSRGLRKLGLEAQATIVACATASEKALIKTAALCLGEGLTAAVQQAVAGLGGNKRVNDVLCDINGERYRGQEWGFVCLRLAQHFDDPASYRSPANLWGDMGAASIPLFAMLACEAAQRGYANGPLSLLWASSEGGQRGAVLLEVSQTRAQRGDAAWQA